MHLRSHFINSFHKQKTNNKHNQKTAEASSPIMVAICVVLQEENKTKHVEN